MFKKIIKENYMSLKFMHVLFTMFIADIFGTNSKKSDVKFEEEKTEPFSRDN